MKEIDWTKVVELEAKETSQSTQELKERGS